ncbi:hypothetical protein O53_1636 [Microcystis aeruginosa TAIHU98]|uniref:Uncharacterized protein n=1 Tax=Microcystis aeruginosa TAIHU98 TaxID=1134457 RepID=L7EDG3_MICAE|nr:hypothetical protein O53_1636 [Microcystis aeruginosa TAIHU98]
MGKVEITERQSEKLALEKNSRLSPFLEKCCLRLVANESFENAPKRSRNDDRDKSIGK